MNIQEAWQKALKQTEIIRPRIEPLSRVAATELPYIFLAESAVNHGDTVVRKGEVTVEKPAIILPSNLPRFEGFESEADAESAWDESGMMQFFLVRGIRFPSLKYSNKTQGVDLHEGSLKQAVQHYLSELQKKENISTGLVLGPEDCWQFSVLIFIAQQSSRQAEGDIKNLWDQFLCGQGWA